MRHHLLLATYFGWCRFIIGLLYNNASLRSFFLGEAGLDAFRCLLKNTLLLSKKIWEANLTANCSSPPLVTKIAKIIQKQLARPVFTYSPSLHLHFLIHPISGKKESSLQTLLNVNMLQVLLVSFLCPHQVFFIWAMGRTSSSPSSLL